MRRTRAGSRSMIRFGVSRRSVALSAPSSRAWRCRRRLPDEARTKGSATISAVKEPPVGEPERAVRDAVDVDVSVIIPTRDRWSVLERFGLRAALSQIEVEVEAIVVDDGSTSRGFENGELDPRVRFARLDEPAGVSAARNFGLELARAPWVAFLDDDDMWAPSKLARTLRAATAAGAGFGYSAVLVVDDDLNPVREVQPAPPESLSHRLLRTNALYAGASNVVASRALLSELGGFDESYSAGRGLGDVAPLGRTRGRGGRSRSAGRLCTERLVGGRRTRPPSRPAPSRAGAPRGRGRLAHLRLVDRRDARSAGRRREAARRYAAAGVRHRSAASLVRSGAVLVRPTTLPPVIGRRPARPDWLEAYALP